MSKMHSLEYKRVLFIQAMDYALYKMQADGEPYIQTITALCDELKAIDNFSLLSLRTNEDNVVPFVKKIGVPAKKSMLLDYGGLPIEFNHHNGEKKPANQFRWRRSPSFFLEYIGAAYMNNMSDMLADQLIKLDGYMQNYIKDAINRGSL